MMIPDNEFDRLIALGRSKGSLGIDDIKEAMPVESMTTEDLAGLVILLEEHGIAIDLDPELLRPNSGPPRPLASPADAPPPDIPSIVPDGNATIIAAPAHPAHESSESDHHDGGSGFSMDAFVYAMAFGLVLFLLAWAAWSYLIR
jgi:hypothetical protein